MELEQQPAESPVNPPDLISMIEASIPPDERYGLTLNMRRRHQKTLQVSAKLAHKMGLIDAPTLHQVMNLFVNYGLEWLKQESLRRQGYR